MISQKEAVYQAILNVLEEKSLPFEEGMNIKDHLKVIRKDVQNVLIEAIKGGSVDMNTDMTDLKLKDYVCQLVSNWARKDQRLNGQIEYQPQKAGIKVGQSDPTIKELNKMLKRLVDTEYELPIRQAIMLASDNLRSSKKKKLSINPDLISDDIRKLLSI